MKAVRICMLAAFFCCVASTTKAQDRPEFTVEADIISRYIWRGMELGKVSLQPTLGIAWKGFSLSAYGNAGLVDKDDCAEIDLTAQYSTGNLSLGIVDYWSDDFEDCYFYYNSHGTAHSFEAFVSYDFGLLNASWQTFFAGNDGVNKSGNRAYSSYLELTAPFEAAGCQCELSLGAVPYATTYYDTNGFSVIKTSLRVAREINITDRFSLPIFSEVVANPRTQKAYLLFGLTLRP